MSTHISKNMSKKQRKTSLSSSSKITKPKTSRILEGSKKFTTKKNRNSSASSRRNSCTKLWACSPIVDSWFLVLQAQMKPSWRTAFFHTWADSKQKPECLFREFIWLAVGWFGREDEEGLRGSRGESTFDNLHRHFEELATITITKGLSLPSLSLYNFINNIKDK